MSSTKLQESYRISPGQPEKGVRGVLEFTVRDRRGNVVKHWFEPNIVKIFAKEMLAHRLPTTERWDINANGGTGGWAATGIDPNEEFSARYIIFGASFDENGVPLDTNDTRYYTIDSVTQQPIPIRLGPGAEYEGGLINAIPITEPSRPLKRIERVSFQPTYQPAGSPLLQEDVRAMNNMVVLETTLRLDEYNGLGVTESDFFTITEIALIGGKKFDSVDACECTPRVLFLEGATGAASAGTAGDSAPYTATANGNDTITLDAIYANSIREGDQIKIVGATDTAGESTIAQVTPFYLVISKAEGGRDCQLDRVPVDTNNQAIIGSIGVYRDTLRIFSHRILSAPLKKSSDFEILVSWRIIFS